MSIRPTYVFKSAATSPLQNQGSLMNASKPGDKLMHLDFLRGWAIFMVFCLHLYGASYWLVEFKWNGFFHDRSSAYHKSMLLFYPCTYGFLGVALFFVLSGYCIHLSFLNYSERAGSRFRFPDFLKAFYVRRFFRIYLAYFAVMIFFFIVGGYWYKDGAWLHFLSHVFFIHNFWPQTFSSIDGVFWSLAYEWQLYCLYPIMLLLRKRFGIGNTLLIVTATSIAYDLVSMLWLTDFFALRMAVLKSQYLFPWTFGVYLCEQHRIGRKVFPESKILLVGALVVACAAFEFWPTRQYIWQIFTPVFGWVIEFCSGRRFNGYFARGFVFLGVVSYSFYLIHGPFIELIIHSPLKKLLSFGYPYNQMTVGGIVVIFLPILLSSWLLYLLIEKPSHEFGLKLTRR